MSAFTDAVSAQCQAEFVRFKKGQGTETEDPFYKFVGEYWKVGVNNPNIDGRTTFHDDKGKPFRPAWSAAFVSFIMRKSEAGNAFFYNEGHIHYVVKAIRDARNGVASKFLGRDPTTQKPKVGDIINAGRGASAGVTFATVLAAYGNKPVPNGNFLATHSDIVVSVDAANRKLRTLGGNVNDTKNLDFETRRHFDQRFQADLRNRDFALAAEPDGRGEEKTGRFNQDQSCCDA